MKTAKFLSSLLIIAACAIAGYFGGTLIGKAMKDKKEDQSAGYIGPSEITLADGVMTPEALLSMGRLSDPQLSPDGKKILYGVSYTSIADNKSCRNLFICDIFRSICLLSFQDNANNVVTNRTSVIAVPKATPKAGLSSNTTKPNRSDKQMFKAAAPPTDIR